MILRIVDSGVESGTPDNVATWATLKASLRLRTDDDQALVEAARNAVIERIERETGMILVPRTFTLYYADLDKRYRLRMPYTPLAAVTSVKYASVTSNVLSYTAFAGGYYAAQGVGQYIQLDSSNLPDFTHAASERWQVVAEFGDGSTPLALKQAVIMGVCADYAGEECYCKALENLIAPYRIPSICLAQSQHVSTPKSTLSSLT